MTTNSGLPIFIAGTYTPFCVLLLPGRLGTVLLTVVWRARWPASG
jgi:channel protein (hemolysin III family)